MVNDRTEFSTSVLDRPTDGLSHRHAEREIGRKGVLDANNWQRQVRAIQAPLATTPSPLQLYIAGHLAKVFVQRTRSQITNQRRRRTKPNV